MSKTKSNLRKALNLLEKQLIYDELNRHEWNKPKTARTLGIGLSSLYRKIKELYRKIKELKIG